MLWCLALVLLVPQVRSLLGVVRPDRQTLLFSATLPRKIESLVAEALSNPVRISVGQLGAANQDVSQRVVLLKGEDL
jgi:ATP-dependent RNA helicase DDX42